MPIVILKMHLALIRKIIAWNAERIRRNKERYIIFAIITTSMDIVVLNILLITNVNKIDFSTSNAPTKKTTPTCTISIA